MEDIKALVGAYADIKSVKEMIETKATPEEYLNTHKKAANLGSIDLHTHYRPITIDLGKLDSSSLTLTAEQKNFCSKSGNNIKVFAFPEMGKKVESLYTSLRMKIRELSVGRNSHLIDAEVYAKELIPYLYKKRDDLDLIKDAVESVYDSSIAEFERQVLSLIPSFPGKETEIRRKIVGIKARTAKQYLDDIDFEVVSEFPSSCLSDTALQGFVEDMRKKYIEKEMISIYEGQLIEMWECLNSYIVNIEPCNGNLATYISPRAKCEKIGYKVDKENVKGLPFLKTISQSLILLSKEMDKDEGQLQGFDLMAAIYGHAAQVGLNLSLSRNTPSWITTDKLLDAYNSYLK